MMAVCHLALLDTYREKTVAEWLQTSNGIRILAVSKTDSYGGGIDEGKILRRGKMMTGTDAWPRVTSWHPHL